MLRIYDSCNNYENKIRGIMLPNFKTCYKATIVKTVWCLHNDRHMDQ